MAKCSTAFLRCRRSRISITTAVRRINAVADDAPMMMYVFKLCNVDSGGPGSGVSVALDVGVTVTNGTPWVGVAVTVKLENMSNAVACKVEVVVASELVVVVVVVVVTTIHLL
jgi:hypothetical protein